MIQLKPFRGTVTDIQDYFTDKSSEAGCRKFITLTDETEAIVNFVVSPSTYVLDQELIQPGDLVTGYYDANLPVILIYPPQYQALILVKENPYRQVKADYFNEQLISSDGLLKLNIDPSTKLRLTNGQAFTGNPANRNLIVVYGPATKSIPAQTTPYQIIVLCET